MGGGPDDNDIHAFLAALSFVLDICCLFAVGFPL